MLRTVKILLVASVVAWLLVGALGNVLDWRETVGSVGAVTSMAAVPGGVDGWRATSSPLVVLGGALFIVAFKAIAGALCAAGAWRMWRNRRAGSETFAQSKALSLAGCGVAVFGLFFGWIVIGEQWFEYWRNDAFREAAGGSALRYGAFIALIALMVSATPD